MKKKLLADHEPLLFGAGFIVLLLAFWETVPLWYALPKGMALFFTTPSKIAAAFYELLLNGTIEKHFYVSAAAFLAGLGLSIAVGLPLGLLVGRSRMLEDLLDPYITAANATPRIVFLPLLILWFGIYLLHRPQLAAYEAAGLPPHPAWKTGILCVLVGGSLNALVGYALFQLLIGAA